MTISWAEILALEVKVKTVVVVWGGVGWGDSESKASQEVGRFGCAKTFVQCIGKFTDALEE